MLDQEALQKLCLSVFEGTRGVTLWFVLPLFILKCAYSQILGNTEGIKDAFKGLIIFFLLMTGFNEILEILFTIPHHFLDQEKAQIFEEIKKINEKNPEELWEASLSVSWLIPQLITKIIESITAILFWLMVILHAAVMVTMSSMAPIIFLTSTLLGIGLGVSFFFSLLIAMSSWPVIFYGFDHAQLWLYQNIPDPFGRSVSEMAIVFLKMVSPLTLAYMSLSSGPGKAVTSSIQTAIKAKNVFQSFSSRNSPPTAKSPQTSKNTNSQTKYKPPQRTTPKRT